jgi:hypothetical protein
MELRDRSRLFIPDGGSCSHILTVTPSAVVGATNNRINAC